MSDQEFIVTWEVSYSEAEKVYHTTEYIEYLEENGIEHTPEMNTPYHPGDFNIEWVKIQDAETDKELWRDPHAEDIPDD